MWETDMTGFRPTLAAAIVAGTCLAGAASAQQAGTYAGTTADGSTINFTVATDTATGALQITAFGFSFKDTCSPGGFTFDSGWGLPGQPGDLTGSTTTYTFSFAYVDVTATIVFSGSSAKGTITNVTPTFVPPAISGAAPKKAAFCSSKKQAYTASISSGSAPPDAKLVQGYVYAGSTRRD